MKDLGVSSMQGGLNTVLTSIMGVYYSAGLAADSYTSIPKISDTTSRKQQKLPHHIAFSDRRHRSGLRNSSEL